MRWMISFLCLMLVACGSEDGNETATTSALVSASTETASLAGDPTPAPDLPTETNAPSDTPAAQSADVPTGAITTAECPDDQFPSTGALSMTDGAVMWLVCSPDEAYRTVIGASDDLVLIEESGSTSVWTIAFSAIDGSEQWRLATVESQTPSGPFDGQGIVVLAQQQDTRALVGVDAETGEERWSIESQEVPIANSPTVAVVGDAVSPDTPSQFRGIDRITGDELWVSETRLLDQSGVFVKRSPAAVLDEVLVVPTGTTITALDMRTGEILWQASQLDHPAAAGDIIVGTSESTVTAIDAASGEELWSAPGRPSYGDLLAIGDGVIVVLEASSPGIIAYELSSGDERWRATRTPQPQMIDGTALILLWESGISVLSTTDGSTLWSATEPFQSPLMNSVGSNGASVFVAINSLPWTD